LLFNFLNTSIFGKLRTHLAKKIIGSFGLKVASVGLAFVTSVTLARVLGAEDYGMYVYAISIITMLQIPACLGLKQLLVREIAVYRANSEFGLMSGLLCWSNQIVLLASLSLAIVAAISVRLFDLNWNSQMQVVFLTALISLPLSSLTTVRQGAMEGLNQILQGQIAEMLVQPLLFMLCVGILYGFFQEGTNVIWIMVARVLTVGIAFGLGTELLRRTIAKIASKASPNYEINNWLHSVLPFLLINATYVIYNQTDALMLGAMRGTVDVGVYYVINRISELTLFIVVAVNTSLTPTIASLYARQNKIQLQKLVTKGSRINMLVSLPIFLVLIVFGKYILMIFGTEFISGYIALIVSCLGKLYIVLTGLTAVLLGMTGYESFIAMAVGTSSIINVVLNYILISQWGIVGASVATGTSIFICNTYLTIIVCKKLRINPTLI